ncbi:MAG: ParB/RepB/Spo0J family partition protein [Ruminococcus sp.]|nr:ParB/RepB/Spo0J family partition protein [Ruminococcus sp.]
MAIPFKFKFLDDLGSMVMNEKIAGKVVEIDIDRIYPNPNQPRKIFNQPELEELAASIRANGIIQPAVVRRIDMGYELIAGERRLRAARLCGMNSIPCIIVETTERGSAMMSLAENMQRKDLNFFEEAEAISIMIELFGYTQEDVASRLGKSQSTIANKMRLLKIPRSERMLMIDYGFTERHARALLAVESPEMRINIINEIYRRKLNVENTERLIESMNKRSKEYQRIRRCRGAFRDVRLFVNTINHAVEVMQAAGINAQVKKNCESEYIEYIVRIPSDRAAGGADSAGAVR